MDINLRYSTTLRIPISVNLLILGYLFRSLIFLGSELIEEIRTENSPGQLNTFLFHSYLLHLLCLIFIEMTCQGSSHLGNSGEACCSWLETKKPNFYTQALFYRVTCKVWLFSFVVQILLWFPMYVKSYSLSHYTILLTMTLPVDSHDIMTGFNGNEMTYHDIPNTFRQSLNLSKKSSSS